MPGTVFFFVHATNKSYICDVMNHWITPRWLRPGDLFAIVSPAGAVVPELVHLAADQLIARGYRVRIMPHALGRYGTYSGTIEERYGDFVEAWSDPDVGAVLCSRGGYGAVGLLDGLDKIPLADNAKWLVGFSDISALHALMCRHRVHSIHGSMARYIKTGGDNLDYTMDLLQGALPELVWRSESGNITGRATGRLVGGNLAVLDALIGTPYDIYRHGEILVIEDISEPIYKVERMLWHLALAGIFDKVKAVIAGDFCDWKPDRNFDTMNSMIRRFLLPYGIPVAFDAPIGHAGRCLPWIEGAMVEIDVREYSAAVRYLR